MKKIAFLTCIVPHYKVWLMSMLSEMYKGQLYVLHGNEAKGTVPEDVNVLPVENNVIINNHYFKDSNYGLVWSSNVWWIVKNRPCLVILQDGTRIISNYFVHLIVKLYRGKVAYYSHGFDHQASLRKNALTSWLVEQARLYYLKSADIVLLYGLKAKEILEKKGVSTRLDVIFNTLNTSRLIKEYSEVKQKETDAIAKRFGIKPDDIIIAYIGRFVPEKKLDVFINTVKCLNQKYDRRIKGLMIGDGPERQKLESLASGSVFFTGFQTGNPAKALINRSHMVFIPGIVGLAIVEAFCAAKPLITIDHDYHSPEIEFLVHGYNGLIISTMDHQKITREIWALVKDKKKLAGLSNNALKTAQTTCSGERMIHAFKKAIDDFLA